MSSLAALFRRTGEESPDDEKLLDLYWNRNELKKEFARLREEQFRQNGRLKEQEGVSARLQQEIDHLETVLTDHERALSLTVFYQLRGVAKDCERKLAAFAEQLKQNREQKLNSKSLNNWNGEKAQEHAGIETRLLVRQENIQSIEQQLLEERRREQELRGLFSFVKRRSVCAVIKKLTDQRKTEKLRETALSVMLDEIKVRAPPDTMGLDISEKRTINFMILAYAQYLFVQLDDYSMVRLVKEASEKSVGSINYGDEKECAVIREAVTDYITAIEGDTGGDFADTLRKRAKLIGDTAVFHDDDVAVPDSGSVAALFKIDGGGKIRKSGVNLLGENYWRIATVLSR